MTIPSWIETSLGIDVPIGFGRAGDLSENCTVLLFKVIESFNGVDFPCLENRAVVLGNVADFAAHGRPQTVGYRVGGIRG